jgi:hypothetical protein
MAQQFRRSMEMEMPSPVRVRQATALHFRLQAQLVSSFQRRPSANTSLDPKLP